LARYGSGYHGKRLCPDIFTEEEVFIVAES
jgi:hypothetical protein